MTIVYNSFEDKDIPTKVLYMTLAGQTLYTEEECAVIREHWELRDVEIQALVNRVSPVVRTLESIKSKRRKLGYYKRRGLKENPLPADLRDNVKEDGDE